MVPLSHKSSMPPTSGTGVLSNPPPTPTATMMQAEQQQQQQSVDGDSYQLDLSAFDLTDFVHNDVFTPRQTSVDGTQAQEDRLHQQQQQQQQQQVQQQQQQHQHQERHSVQSSPMSMPTPPSNGEQHQLSHMSHLAPDMQQHNMQQQSHQHSQSGGFLPSAAALKDSFHLQQLRFHQIQQLQQMQQQIMQQQMELLSGQIPPQTMQGLLTPAPSNELRATVNQDYVSPMMLQSSGMYVQNGSDPSLYNSLVAQGMPPGMPNPSFSAPAAFQFSGLPSTGEAFSPLTSPALGPMTYTHSALPQRLQHNQQQVPVSVPLNVSLPLGGDSSSIDFSAALSSLSSPSSAQSLPQLGSYTASMHHPSPYMQPTISAPPSTIIRPINTRSRRPSSAERDPAAGAGVAGKKRAGSPVEKDTTRPTRSRGSRSSKRASVDVTSSTPSVFHGTMSAPTFPTMDGAVNTPSPVDISMPPPVTLPEPPNELLRLAAAAPISKISATAPVTPATLMNLPPAARLPSGLTPTTGQSGSSNGVQTRATRSKTPGSKKHQSLQEHQSASGLKLIAAAKPSTAPKPTISPSLKPILPGGLSAEAVQHLHLKSNYQNILEGRASDLGISLAPETHVGMEVRKTSHKAAEQKRRDSLKAGFDDLRLLLPPITIDPDAEGAEHLPGSAPPRGPARNVPPGSEDHPNRGVSKLALLRHSNEFIVKLGKRIERRDKAIAELRLEVEQLRERLGEGEVGSVQWEDLDEEEKEEEERKNAKRIEKEKAEQKECEGRPASGISEDDAMDETSG